MEEKNIYQKTTGQVKDWFTNNIFYIIIFIVVGIWILRGLLTLEPTGKSIQDIITSSALFLIFSIVIGELSNFQGIFKGGKTEFVKSIKQRHNELVGKVEKYGDKIDGFCERKNIENKKSVRSRILISEGMAYADYFNDDGSAKENISFDISKIDKIEKTIKRFGKEKKVKVKDKVKIKKMKDQERAYYKALRLKLTPLTANELISENSKPNDKFNFGITLDKFIKLSSMSGLFMQVVSAFIIGYYMLGLAQNFSLFALVWAIFQAVLFLIFGFWKYFKSYLYMQNGYAERISLHNQYLGEFNAECELLGIKGADQMVSDIAKKVAEKFEISNNA